MKILLLKNSADFVDITKSTYNLQEIGLARAFNKKGHKCDVVYWGGKEEKVINIIYDNDKYFKLFYLRGFNFFKNGIYGRRLNKLCKDYDIIHSGGYDQIQSWILADKFPEKLIIYNGTYYSDFNVRYNKKCKIIDKIFLPRYKKNKIFFDTKSRLSAQFLMERGLKNVTSIGVGIDLERLQAKKMIESELSIQIQQEKENGIKFITYIGKLEERRNIEFLIEVFSKVCKECKNVKLLLVGKGNEEYKRRCFNKISYFNLKEKVIYKESISQELLPKIYTLSDVFLLPTRYEIFGMVLLEAMYFGLPVFTTYNGGSSTLIKDGNNGVIINEFDSNLWSTKVISILENDRLAKSIGKNAHDTICNSYTWDVLSDKFIKLYNQKLNKIE